MTRPSAGVGVRPALRARDRLAEIAANPRERIEVGSDVDGCEDDIETGRRPGTAAEVAAIGRGGTGGLLHERGDQRVFDSEDAVTDRELRVIVDEDVGDQGAQSFGGDHEVQVRGTQGERPTALSIMPTGPSSGIG